MNRDALTTSVEGTRSLCGFDRRLIGQLHLVLRVRDGVADRHGGPDARKLIECGVSEDRADVIHDVRQADGPSDVAVASAGAVERRGDLGSFESVEQDGKLAECNEEVADVVASSVERLQRGLEQSDGPARITVAGF